MREIKKPISLYQTMPHFGNPKWYDSGTLYPLGQFAESSSPKLSQLVGKLPLWIGLRLISFFCNGYRTNPLYTIGQPEFICLLQIKGLITVSLRVRSRSFANEWFVSDDPIQTARGQRRGVNLLLKSKNKFDWSPSTTSLLSLIKMQLSKSFSLAKIDPSTFRILLFVLRFGSIPGCT